MKMNPVVIRVYKGMDKFVFSTLPSIRDAVKKLFPDAHPANYISVSYDLRSGFEVNYSKLENQISFALLGVDNENDLKKIGEIHFIDTVTGDLLHKVIPGD